MMSDR
jgi:hypothetical protein